MNNTAYFQIQLISQKKMSARSKRLIFKGKLSSNIIKKWLILGIQNTFKRNAFNLHENKEKLL